MSKGAVLPSVMYPEARITSSGFSENIFGVGSIGLGFRKENGHYMDVGEIWFQNMSIEKFKELDEKYTKTPHYGHDPDHKAYVDAKRRISFKQAMWLKNEIEKHLAVITVNGIPHDDDL